ncbi:5-formyltetrahydrofolate cyclo-ligase [Elioraea tepidiphila]|jgi:5-formyltetrahydrofolate cyclo-ligase|uniref:5-formyltetrahydrofolate cyclo-ligase n=1 Tax=Elioraea tepidiphila TaxID=457934 RepID=UPI00036BF8A3|nr:5-formyltetrahydrofolate cyclo-ligase [Elioraea tepidiphila]
MSTVTLIEAKRAARAAGLAAREAGDPRAGLRLAGHVLERFAPPPGAVVAGYWPLGREIDPRPLMLALAGRGHPLVLPVTGKRGTPLVFRRFRFGDPLVVGPFGTRQPDADAEALAPTFLLVPVVAFDATGVRIGHGAGYYDATLAVLRARRAVVALGCGYASQQAATLPVGAHDQRLDAIVTEQGVLRA